MRQCLEARSQQCQRAGTRGVRSAASSLLRVLPCARLEPAARREARAQQRSPSAVSVLPARVRCCTEQARRRLQPTRRHHSAASEAEDAGERVANKLVKANQTYSQCSVGIKIVFNLASVTLSVVGYSADSCPESRDGGDRLLDVLGKIVVLVVPLLLVLAQRPDVVEPGVLPVEIAILAVH